MATSGAIKRVWSSQVTLEAAGASVANNAISAAANDVAFDLASLGGEVYLPHCEFVVGLTFATAPTVNTIVELVGRELDTDGSNDSPVPDATYRPVFGRFVLLNVTTLQTLKCEVFNCPPKADWYLFNNATGQTFASVAAWTMKVRAFSLVPA